MRQAEILDSYLYRQSLRRGELRPLRGPMGQVCGCGSPGRGTGNTGFSFQNYAEVATPSCTGAMCPAMSPLRLRGGGRVETRSKRVSVSDVLHGSFRRVAAALPEG